MRTGSFLAGIAAVLSVVGCGAGGDGARESWGSSRADLTFAPGVKLTNQQAEINDHIGSKVAIVGDTAAVSAPNAIGYQGAVSVWDRSGAAWKQEAKLVIASDGAAYDQFGFSMALAQDLLVVGAYGKDKTVGAAYAYVRNGATWTEQRLLPTGKFAKLYGYSVATDGTTIVVGAPYDSEKGQQAGAVYVFAKNGASFEQVAKLTSSQHGQVGTVVAVDGDTILSGGSFGDTDVAIFSRAAGVWSGPTTVTSFGSGARPAWFGASLAVRGDELFAGAPADDEDYAYGGAVYSYRRVNGVWTNDVKLRPKAPFQNAHYGTGLGFDGTSLVVGAWGDGNTTGAAYSLARNGSGWKEAQVLSDIAPKSADELGYAVAVAGNTVLVGEPGYDSTRGAFLVFEGDCAGACGGEGGAPGQGGAPNVGGTGPGPNVGGQLGDGGSAGSADMGGANAGGAPEPSVAGAPMQPGSAGMPTQPSTGGAPDQPAAGGAAESTELGGAGVGGAVITVAAPSNDSGCGCRAAGATEHRAGFSVWLTVLLGLWGQRRRAQRASKSRAA